MSYTLDAFNRENFYPVYREFCESLIKGVIRKHSNLNSHLTRLDNLESQNNGCHYSQMQQNLLA